MLQTTTVIWTAVLLVHKKRAEQKMVKVEDLLANPQVAIKGTKNRHKESKQKVENKKAKIDRENKMEERITKEVKTISGRTKEEEVRTLLQEPKVKKGAKVNQMAVLEAP